jgi:hypothetical protein
VRKPFSNQFKHFACEMMLAEHCIFGHIQSVVYWKFQEIGICAMKCEETQSNTYHEKKYSDFEMYKIYTLLPNVEKNVCICFELEYLFMYKG